MEVFISGVLRSAVGGAESVKVRAESIRELLEKLSERYPEIRRQLDRDGMAVSINGDIYRDSWSRRIPPDAEVFLLPRIQGG